MKYGTSTLVSIALSTLLMVSAFGASKDSSQDLFQQKTTVKVFKDVRQEPFEVNGTNLVKTKYEYFLEGTEPQEKNRNQKVNKITTEGQSIEVRSQKAQTLTTRVEALKITDERKRVEKPHDYPNSTNVFMKMFFGKGYEAREYNGSGVMVGPYSVLTAAHNVYDISSRLWAEHIAVSPGANSGSAYFGTSNVAKAFIPKEYFDGNENYDMALLTIDQAVGKQTGWATLCVFDDDEFEDMNFWVTGYPGDKEAGQLWEMKGPISDAAALVLKHKIGTVEGQSGSPLWQKSKKGKKPPRVVGVHVRAGSGEWNEATRITRDRLDWIVGCLTETTSQQFVQQASSTPVTPSVSSSAKASSSVSPNPASAPTDQPWRALARSTPPTEGVKAPSSVSAAPQPAKMSVPAASTSAPPLPPKVLKTAAPLAQATPSVPRPMDIAIPEVARGYEEVYRRFLGGKLIYTDPTSQAKTELPIRALANPLEGTFDLSGCGDTGKYLSISTGYRKGVKAENSNKTEIWLAPWFLVNKNLSSSAKHLQPIMGSWDAAKAPVGLFWTWGGWGNEDYCYLVSESLDQLSSEDLWEKYRMNHLQSAGVEDVLLWHICVFKFCF